MAVLGLRKRDKRRRDNMIENYETFNDNQKQILERFVSSTTSNVFVLRNLPEVIKGALFSRYSRTTLGLRSLLLKEFINSEDLAFTSIVGEAESNVDQAVAIQKAQSFYDRILDGYGDDSIGELGGAHLAVENVTMLAAKVIEDCRIGGSPLEKYTRYVYFDQKIDGEYLFYRDPVLMTSAYREDYLDLCNMLFETYSNLIPPTTELLKERFPQEEGMSSGAYKAALRAKVLDCLRGILPASTLTNMGVFGNGRFFEGLIQKLNGQSLSELQDIGKKAFDELSTSIPSFVRRAEPTNRHYQSFNVFREQMRDAIRLKTREFASEITDKPKPGVRLIRTDEGAERKVASALLFSDSDKPLGSLDTLTKSLSDEDVDQILSAAAAGRTNRRHKGPRALEHATFTFEIVADFGAYRDLQRHRMLTQDRQLLGCELGYYVPEELIGTKMEKEYRAAMDKAASVVRKIGSELPEESQYAVPMGYNIHWYFHCNLRALQWLCELRSAPAGHAVYRFIAQALADEVARAHPAFERFFQFVDYEGYELGRLGQEERIERKKVEK